MSWKGSIGLWERSWWKAEKPFLCKVLEVLREDDVLLISRTTDSFDTYTQRAGCQYSMFYSTWHLYFIAGLTTMKRLCRSIQKTLHSYFWIEDWKLSIMNNEITASFYSLEKKLRTSERLVGWYETSETSKFLDSDKGTWHKKIIPIQRLLIITVNHFLLGRKPSATGRPKLSRKK